MQWWQDSVVYQIYPRSFQDSNGDGIGDIQGIISRLDDLQDLGVSVLWLSPVYPSPNADYGYDISNYVGIHPDFGTMDDMDVLLSEAKKRNIKIIMDLVINHTSDEHPWFKESKNPKSPYRDYYIWKQGKNKAPNNWTGFFGEPCWEFDRESGEYYLHLFAKNQPDLNYQNPKVLAEVKKIMRFWLDKGVAGFRCDVINVLHKSSFKDGKRRFFLKGMEYYISQEGCHDILQELRREVLDGYDCFTVGETVFVSPKDAHLFCAPERKELNMLFSFEHMETDQFLVKWFKRKFSAKRLAMVLAKWQTEVAWNANYLENHDQPRSVSRFGNDQLYWEESAKLLALLLFTLRGTPFVYQGQEIGMTNFDFSSMEDIRDVESKNIYALTKKMGFSSKARWRMMQKTSRDNARTPVQWSNARQGGFTTGESWIRVNANYAKINMHSQKEDEFSVRSFYKRMIKLRKQNAVLKEGSFELVKATNSLMVFKRVLGKDSLTIALNFSSKKRRVDTALQGSVLLSTYERVQGDQVQAQAQAQAQAVKADSFSGTLRPWEAVILR